MTHSARSRGAHRAPTPPPLHLTRRGRIVRDLIGGAALLALAVFATPISIAFFTVAAWAGRITGLSA